MPSLDEPDRLRSPILIDGGTTNTRAWATENGRVIQRFETDVGLRDVAAGDRIRFEAALRELLEEVSRSMRARSAPAPSCVVVAGMIASEQGLGDVPHVPVPAGISEIASGSRWLRIRWLTDLEVLLVPGVRSGATSLSPAVIDSADVMRGEETLALGLLATGGVRAGGTLLNLGSHWKLIRTDGVGRVAGSRTSLTGELIHAAQTRTILAASLPHGRPAQIDPNWMDAGSDTCRSSGLPRALFCVRLLDQRSAGTAEQRLSFLVGAFMAADLDPLIASGILAGEGVAIAGDPVLAGAMSDRLVRQGIAAAALTPDQIEEGMTRGLYLIARAAS